MFSWEEIFLYPGQRKIFPMFSLEKNIPLSWIEESFPYVFLGKNISSIMNRGKFLLFSLEKNFPLSWIEENFPYPWRKLFLYPGQRKIFPMFSLGKDFSLSQIDSNVPYVFVRKNFSLSWMEENFSYVFLGKIFFSILNRGKFFLCFTWDVKAKQATKTSNQFFI